MMNWLTCFPTCTVTNLEWKFQDAERAELELVHIILLYYIFSLSLVLCYNSPQISTIFSGIHVFIWLIFISTCNMYKYLLLYQ